MQQTRHRADEREPDASDRRGSSGGHVHEDLAVEGRAPDHGHAGSAELGQQRYAPQQGHRRATRPSGTYSTSTLTSCNVA